MYMVVQGGNISQPKFIRYYTNSPSSSKDSLTVNDYLLVESRDKYPWMTEENMQEERLEGQEKRTGDDEELTNNDENLKSNKKVFDRTGDDEEVKNDDEYEDLQSNKEIFDKTGDDEEVKNDDDEDLQSNKEVFDRILKFKKMHGRFPDLNDAEEKKMIGVSGNENLEKNRDDEEGSTLDDDFPSPFLQEEQDTNQVEDIFSTVDGNVKETTVVYKEDEKGNIRIQRFIQTKHEDGTFTTEIYELKKDEEMTEKSPFSEQNEEEEEEGRGGSGEDDFQDPENFDQDFEEQTQGNLMETPFSPDRIFFLFIYIALEVSLMKSTHTFSCSVSGYFHVGFFCVLFCGVFFFDFSDHQVFSRSLQSLTPMFDM